MSFRWPKLGEMTLPVMSLFLFSYLQSEDNPVLFGFALHFFEILDARVTQMQSSVMFGIAKLMKQM